MLFASWSGVVDFASGPQVEKKADSTAAEAQSAAPLADLNLGHGRSTTAPTAGDSRR